MKVYSEAEKKAKRQKALAAKRRGKPTAAQANEQLRKALGPASPELLSTFKKLGML